MSLIESSLDVQIDHGFVHYARDIGAKVPYGLYYYIKIANLYYLE